MRVWGEDDTLYAAAPFRSSDCLLPLLAVRALSVDPSSAPACSNKGGAQLLQRTNELNLAGRGLANIRLPITPRALLHPKKRVTTLARRVVKHCIFKLGNSDAPLLVEVTTQLTLTLRRRG